MRGKHQNKPKKIPALIKDSVHEHIQSFPKVESHYCRSTTQREYLDETLSINKMYILYKSWMDRTGRKEIATEHYYRYTFNNSYNLSFHKPKKDQCDVCIAYKFQSDEEKQKKQEIYTEHLLNKAAARKQMKEDKEEAKKNSNICCASFDLQKVLTTPRAEISVMYYKRKLSIFNFTIYNMATSEGESYIWNETVAKRGANEISSCLWKYIATKVEAGVKDFRFYSDNCGGQNRNYILYSMYAKAAADFNITIKHRYLVKGHTQMDGDSMHSTIERAATNKFIFSQDDWVNLIKNAKNEEPKYKVNQMNQSEILDFSLLASKKSWHKIRVSKISEIQFHPNAVVNYIYNYDNNLLTNTIDYNKNHELTICYDSLLSLDQEMLEYWR